MKGIIFCFTRKTLLLNPEFLLRHFSDFQMVSNVANHLLSVEHKYLSLFTYSYMLQTLTNISKVL